MIIRNVKKLRKNKKKPTSYFNFAPNFSFLQNGDFVYYCKQNGGFAQKVCVGCQYRDKRLYNGDRYQRDDMVYKCEVRSDKYGHKPVGCVVREPDGTTLERVIGCRW